MGAELAKLQHQKKRVHDFVRSAPMLRGEINDTSHHAKPEPRPKSPPPSHSSRYDTESAKELLAKLAAEGKIKLPPGFDTDSKGD